MATCTARFPLPACTARCQATTTGARRARVPSRNQPARRDWTRRATQEAPDTTDTTNLLNYKHVMVAILDQSAYLSAGSRQAINAGAGLAKQHGSKLTVLLVDEHGLPVENAEVRIQTVDWHLKESGCPEFQVVERAVESKSSVLLGDVADDMEADLMVVSCDAVHSKRVDANLLAEFVPCPVMLLP